ncbi:MAG: 16S rRNA (uracil(1498)-N(3))-methyltransferase [Halioglobus sp.]|nr:16S rRNA (uracil(1498)-N(3))-methyltransferase [Halioglobus sp.]
MRLTRIYTLQALHSGASFVLEPGPSRHIARALRMNSGDALTLFDGRGGEYLATIDAIDKKSVSVTTGEHDPVERESGLAIHLGIAMSRGDRFDWVVQKSTELGVSRITPLTTEHTGVQLKGERLAKKLAHWRQVAISACEQCGRNRVPQIDSPDALDAWVSGTTATARYVLHPQGQPLPSGITSTPSVALLVGPEGGLSEGEIARAEAADYRSLTLGPRVLRTETAPLAAIAVLQAHWGDMACR